MLMPENRLYSTCFKYNPPKKQRFGGPVFCSALSRNSMSRIREGRTWRFHCNLYIHVRDLYKMPRLGGPVFSSALSIKTNLSLSLNSMSRIREGRTWRFHCNFYICNPYKMPRFGGPVFSIAFSR